VDIAAKVTLLLPVFNLTYPHSDYSSLTCIPALKQLLQSWNNETQSKLYEIERTVNVINSSLYLAEIEIEIVIQRFRIGHTYLTHRHLVQGQIESSSLGRVDLNYVYFHKCVGYAYILFTTTQPMTIVFESFLVFNN